jgi:DNA-binding transcriptional LysR family regulator
MDLKLLRAFVAVADSLSFRAAAEQRRVTQPALSMQIMTLERELGVTLLERGKGRKVLLTPSGEAFLEGARVTLQSAESAVENARRRDEGRVGHLRIGFSDDFIYSSFPDVMAEFHRRHPNTTVTYQQALSAELLNRLRGGLLDLMLACFPLAAPGPNIKVSELPRLPIGAIVSRRHRLADRQSIWLRELSEDGFLLFPQEIMSGFSAHIARLFAHARFTPHVAGYIQSTLIMAELAARGAGVGLMTRTSLPPNLSGVRLLDLRDRQAAVDSGALYPMTASKTHAYAQVEQIVAALRDAG